jgi:hypothetical protein
MADPVNLANQAMRAATPADLVVKAESSRSCGRDSGELGCRTLQPSLRTLETVLRELQSLQDQVSNLQRSPLAQPPTTELPPPPQEALHHQELLPPAPTQLPQIAGVPLLHLQEPFGRVRQGWWAARGHAVVTTNAAADDDCARGHAVAAVATFFAACAFAFAFGFDAAADDDAASLT